MACFAAVCSVWSLVVVGLLRFVGLLNFVYWLVAAQLMYSVLVVGLIMIGWAFWHRKKKKII